MTFKPLVPKHPDGVVRVISIARLSKENPDNDNESLEASLAAIDKYLDSVDPSPKEVVRLSEQISGMVRDRETIRQAEDLIDAGWADLVIGEDIGRLFRNPRDIHGFPQYCVDKQVRFIAVADRIDTADDEWETAVAVAAIRHGFAVPEAKRRVKRTATHSFPLGGMVLKIPFGFKKLTQEEARSGQFGPVGLRVMRLSEWTATIREIVLRVIQGESYTMIADWLNEQGVPVGPFVKRSNWTARLVAALVNHQLLSGTRSFRRYLFTRIFGTGDYRRELNPNGPELQFHRELAHLNEQETVALREALAKRKGDREPLSGNKHPLWQKPRAKALFPAQHSTCAICKEIYHAYERQNFKCSRSSKHAEHRCWNHVQFNGLLAQQRIIEWLISVLEQIPGLRTRIVESVWFEIQRSRSKADAATSAVDLQIADLKARQSRLVVAIQKGGKLDGLVSALADVERDLKKAQETLKASLKVAKRSLPVETKLEVESRLNEVMLHFAKTSHDFATLLRRLITRFEIVPMLAVDSGQVRPRARVTVSFRRELDASATHVDGVIDLFDPPMHIKHLPACRQAKQECLTDSLKTIAAKLGVNYMTVKRSLDLARTLEAMGLSEPYQELRERPERAARWRQPG